ATTHFKQIGNLFSKNSLAALSFAPARIVKLVSAARVTNALEHFRFSLREMFVQPMFEQRRDRPWQSQQDMSGKLRPGFCARSDNRWNLVIVNSGNDRRDHHADRDSGGAQLRDCLQPRGWH